MGIGKARLVGSAIGIALLGATVLATSNSRLLHAMSSRRSLTVNDAVINFTNQSDRVTIRLDLDNVPTSQNVNDFEIQVIITDKRSLAMHDTGPVTPTAVR